MVPATRGFGAAVAVGVVGAAVVGVGAGSSVVGAELDGVAGADAPPSSEQAVANAASETPAPPRSTSLLVGFTSM
jgi:hypothetical protein